MGLKQFVDQGGGGVETYSLSLAARVYSDGGGEVRLPGTVAAYEDHILPAVDETAAGQLDHQRLIEGWDSAKVEVIQSLD